MLIALFNNKASLIKFKTLKKQTPTKELLDDIGGVIEAERFSVMDGRSELVKGIAVFFGRIAHIFIPTILWKFMMKVDHQLVSVVFC